jgi:serine/threonine protein kinase
VKLIDFGVAEWAERPETDLPKIDESLTIVPVPSKAGLEGTRTFLAPECWEGNIFFF